MIHKMKRVKKMGFNDDDSFTFNTSFCGLRRSPSHVITIDIYLVSEDKMDRRLFDVAIKTLSIIFNVKLAVVKQA